MATKLVHSVRIILEQNPEYTSSSAGLNASGTSKWTGEWRGVLWGKSRGRHYSRDPLRGPYFCVVIHKLVRKAELILRNSVGIVRYGWDNGYLLGKKVLQAFEEISRHRCR